MPAWVTPAPAGCRVGVQVEPYGADPRTLYWAHWVERALS
jgi:hypothetical protein